MDFNLKTLEKMIVNAWLQGASIQEIYADNEELFLKEQIDITRLFYNIVKKYPRLRNEIEQFEEEYFADLVEREKRIRDLSREKLSKMSTREIINFVYGDKK